MNPQQPRQIRLTMPTRAVMDLLINADANDPPWGYRICEEAELQTGTVYPILKRLEQAGWVAGVWEVEEPIARPKRRTFVVTPHGAEQYASARNRKQRRRKP